MKEYVKMELFIHLFIILYLLLFIYKSLLKWIYLFLMERHVQNGFKNGSVKETDTYTFY